MYKHRTKRTPLETLKPAERVSRRGRRGKSNTRSRSRTRTRTRTRSHS